MKTQQLGVFAGIRNDISPERFSNNDLIDAVNVDITHDGKLLRREGQTLTLTGVMHSLFSDGLTNLVVESDNLTLLDNEFGKKVLCPVTGDKLAYVSINGKVYWSDAEQSGSVYQGEYRQWGISVPPRPVISAIVGNLPAGTYLTTCTYVDSDGKESGAPASNAITLSSVAGLTIQLPASSDPTVVGQNLYLSTTNGEVCYLVAQVANVDSTLTISDMPSYGPVVRTQFMGPAPAGRVLGFYGGRAYVALGRYLWYSQPYEYELFDLRSGYIGFDSNVTTLSPVSDGLYVGTDLAVHWLEGQDPTQFKEGQVAAYGAVHGTEQEVPGYYVGKDGVPGVVQTIMTSRGMCGCFDHGEFKNLTGNRFTPVAASTGASLLKVRGGTPLLTTTLFKE